MGDVARLVRAPALLAAALGVLAGGWIALGRLATPPASLFLPARAWYRGAYFVVAIFAQLAVLVVATRLIVGQNGRLGLLLTGAMAVGLVALVAGRVA